MLITLISIGNINAQEMKNLKFQKLSEFPTGNENTGFEQYFIGEVLASAINKQ